MESFRCTQQHLSSNYNYKREIQSQLIKALPDRVVTMTQAGKVVRTAASILRLNLLECSLLAWLLKRSNYTLRDLSSSANHISLFQEDQNKELLLLILLNAYYVKTFLTKESAPNIDSDVLSMMPNFAKIYKTWRPDNLLKDVSLSELNVTFNGWTLPPKRARPDYNQYVNKILQLSKTYNVAGNEEETGHQGPKKKVKKNIQEEEEEEEEKEQKTGKGIKGSRTPIKQIPLELKQEDEDAYDSNESLDKNYMWLRSSRMSDRNQLNPDIFDYQEQFMAPEDFLRRSSRQRVNSYNNPYLFDLQNSKNGPQNMQSLLNNSIIKTSTKGLFTEQKVQPKPKIKITSSFDQLKE